MVLRAWALDTWAVGFYTIQLLRPMFPMEEKKKKPECALIHRDEHRA